ncbi:NPC1 [Symbiodinium sp. CCMP2592]|nr:NPC1 [Symbiodinium sp. CCMP2592]
MSPLQAWLACTSRAEESVAHGLGKVAKSCARNPWKCVAVTVVGCLLCALGVLRFTAVSEARDLWVDQGSQAMKDLEWTEQYFANPGRVNRVLVTAKDGGNILRLETMAEIFRMADDAKALSDADGKTFADVCLRVSSGCLNAGIRRYFGTGTTADFNQTVQSQADILVAVNKANFPDGAPAFADDSMGGIARDGSGSITSATAVRVDFILDAAEEAMMKWEEALVQHFTKDQLTEQGYEHVNAFVQAERSQDDELNRTVQADIPLFAIAFVLMASFCSIFLGKTASWTQSRRLLGAVEFYLVIFGCIAGYGTCMLIGVPFTVLQQILPFILVGIGIDDAFVISGAFDAVDPSLSIPDRIEKAMQRVGVSITLTKVTSISSFLLGATCVFPSVQYFCFYASVSCFFIWLLHCTTFCALLALDARRASADPPRLDPCFCVGAGASCMPSKKSSEGSAPLERVLVAMIKFLTSHPAISFATVILFLAVAAVSAWQVSLGLSTDFDIMDLSPDKSYLRDFYNQENLHFGGLSTGGLALPAALYVADQDFSSLAVQRHLEEAGAELMALSNVNSVRGLQSWHTVFTLWALQNKGVLPSLPDSAFTAVETNRTGCQAGLPSAVTTCTSHLVTGSTFLPALQEFLSTPTGKAFEDDVVVQDGQIKVIRLRANHIDTFNSKQQVALLEEVEAFTAQWQSALPGSFVSSPAYIFFDQYRIIVEQMTVSIALCLAAVLLISALVLAHPLSVMVVLLVLALVFMDLMGNIVLWSLALNSISMINLIMAVGLVVDYSMHMAHSFGLQDGSLPRAKRAELAMKEMGQPIFLGVSTTFLAILPLAFSASQAFRVFFKMFFGIVVAGGSHGLIFLPVCMSMFGPSVTKPAATEGALDADVEKPSKADKEEAQKAKELDDKWTVEVFEC